MPHQRAHPRSHHRPAGVAEADRPPSGRNLASADRTRHLAVFSRPLSPAPHPRSPLPARQGRSPRLRADAGRLHLASASTEAPLLRPGSSAATVRSHPHLRRRRGQEQLACQRNVARIPGVFQDRTLANHVFRLAIATIGSASARKVSRNQFSFLSASHAGGRTRLSPSGSSCSAFANPRKPPASRRKPVDHARKLAVTR